MVNIRYGFGKCKHVGGINTFLMSMTVSFRVPDRKYMVHYSRIQTEVLVSRPNGPVKKTSKVPRNYKQ
jgi:hypothetical protein